MRQFEKRIAGKLREGAALKKLVDKGERLTAEQLVRLDWLRESAVKLRGQRELAQVKAEIFREKQRQLGRKPQAEIEAAKAAAKKKRSEGRA